MTTSDFLHVLSPAFEVLEHPAHFELVCRTCRRGWMTPRDSVARSGYSPERLLAHARRERVHQLA